MYYLCAGASGQLTDLLRELSEVSKVIPSQCLGQPALQVVGQAWGRPDALHPDTPKGERHEHSRPFKLGQFPQFIQRDSTTTLRKYDHLIQKV